MGVTRIEQNGQGFYECVIHIHGNYLVGRYADKITAAIAYNKAVDILAGNGIHKKYVKNYINEYSTKEYQNAYEQIPVSERILHYTEKMIEET